MENTMKKLLVYLKDYKKESVLGPLFKLLEATFELIVPLVMAAIIDTGVATGDKSYIMKMCMVLVLLAVIGLTCSVTAQYFAAKAAVGFATKLRHALFAHIESLSFTEMDTVGTATLITRMTSDVNQVQNGVNLVLRLFLRSPFIVFGAMVMAFTIDVKAALVFVVTIPLLSIIVFGIMLISIPLYKKVQSALDKVLGITRENLTGSRVIRAFNKEDDEKVHFNRLADMLYRLIASIRITRTVRNKQSVILHPCKVMVPRNTDHFHIPFQQTTDDICLYPTIHQHHFFLTCTFIVTNDFLTRYFIYIIDTCIHCFGHIAGFIIKYNFPHHYPMFAKNFGQFTGIDACSSLGVVAA